MQPTTDVTTHPRSMVLIILSIAAIIWLATCTRASGADELGQFCWSLTPYVDTVRLSVSLAHGQVPVYGHVPMFHILAEWRAGPAPANQTVGGASTDTRTTQYHFLGTGVGRQSKNPKDPPGSITVGINMTRTFGLSSEFGGEEDCNLVLTLSGQTLNGRFGVSCPGITTLPLDLSATAIFHACSAQQ